MGTARLPQIFPGFSLGFTSLHFKCHRPSRICNPQTRTTMIRGTHNIWNHFQQRQVHGRTILVYQRQDLPHWAGHRNRMIRNPFASHLEAVPCLDVRVYHRYIYASAIYLLSPHFRFRSTHCARCSLAGRLLEMSFVAKNAPRRMPEVCKMLCSLEPC